MILGAAAALLFVVGVILAIAQPGNLGDDETAAGTTTSSSSSSSTSSSSSSSSTLAPTTTAAGQTTTTAGGQSTTTSAPMTTTTAPSGSGLDGKGSGSVPGGVADTGGPAWILPVGGVLLLVGIGTRRLARA